MVNADKQAVMQIVSCPSKGAHAVPVPREPKVIMEIAEAINPVIADGFALYEKTKNFYLNLAGSANRSYKLLFDDQAQEIFASMDTLAELVRQIGAVPLRSISHSGEAQSVENYNSDFLLPAEMVGELISDNRRIADSLRAAGRICETTRETTIGNILQDILGKTERRIGFLERRRNEDLTAKQPERF